MNTETKSAIVIKRFQCRHIHTDGRRCASPSLRGEDFCYFHHTTRGRVAHPSTASSSKGGVIANSKKESFTLPLPEDRSAIQLSIGEVLQRIASNSIDPRRAGLLLYGLQIASLNLGKHIAPDSQPIEEIVNDADFGPLAPQSEVTENNGRESTVVRILREWNEQKAREKELAAESSPGTLPSVQAVGTNENAVILSEATRKASSAVEGPRESSRRVCRSNRSTTTAISARFTRPNRGFQAPESNIKTKPALAPENTPPSISMGTVNTNLLFQNPADLATPLLAVFAVDTSTGPDATPALLTTSSAITAVAAPWLASQEFKATIGETLLLHTPSGLKAERLLIIGLGKAKSLTIHEARKGAGAAVRFCRPRGLHELAIAFPESESLPVGPVTRALIEGAFIADFDIDTYRSDRKDQSIHALTLVTPVQIKNQLAAIELGLNEGRIFGTSQNFARALVNEPGNVLTPTELGHRATAMAESVGLHCEVHSMDKILALKMGAFAAVTQGSSEPPALIVLRYEPPTAPAGDSPTLGLVGKGITFDTGGISIKPADNMDKMKYDMAGSAAMLGAMRAIALLKPTVRVISVICSCENMPDGRAFKPGDVLTAMSGKTIEVLNTDAEGRLVLADGLHYAQQLGATVLVDAATLTGAIGVALGQLNAGLFTNSDETSAKFFSAAWNSGEKFWSMPCTDDYRDQIKSSIADIQNTGNSRYGGSITAAMFLKEFVGETPWLHLDIASTAWIDEHKAWQSKGPSGIAVRSITEWVRGYASTN